MIAALAGDDGELPEPRGEPSPRKGETVLVLWLEAGSTTTLVWTAAVVWKAMPSRGLFIAEWPASSNGELEINRHTFDVDNYDWKRP